MHNYILLHLVEHNLQQFLPVSTVHLLLVAVIQTLMFHASEVPGNAVPILPRCTEHPRPELITVVILHVNNRVTDKPHH